MRNHRLIWATLACAAFLLSSLPLAGAVPLPSPRPYDAPSGVIKYALEIENAQFRTIPLQETAQPQATQAQAPTPVPGTGGSTTIATTGPVTSDTKISVGTIAGDVLTWIAAAFSGPIALMIIGILWRVFSGMGLNISENAKKAASERLQEIMERGIIWAAGTAKKTLDGKIPVDVKSEVVAKAIGYVREHAADTIKQLGVDPGSQKAETALVARAEAALANPAVPVTVAPEPVAPAVVPVGAIDPAALLAALKQLRGDSVLAPGTV